MAGTTRRLNHEGSLTQLPSGSWRAQITLDGRRLGKTFPRQSQARDWLAEMYAKKADGYTYDAHRTTLAEFAAAWYKTKSSGIKQATRESYTTAMRVYLVPALGKYKLSDLTPAIIQTKYDVLADGFRAAGRTSTPLGVAHIVLSEILDHAERLGILNRNPARLVIVPRVKKPKPAAAPSSDPTAQVTQFQVWNESQVARFLASLTDRHRNRCLYRLAIATGMRQGELCALQWSDVDWLKSTLRIKAQITRPQGGGWEFADPKSAAGNRTIRLGPGLISALREQSNQVQLMRQVAGDRWTDHDLVFPNRHGAPLLGSYLAKEFRRLIQQFGGLPPIHFHSMRHTAASLMLMHNVPLAEVSSTLGHASPAVTLQIYAKFIPQDHSLSASIMDAITTTTVLDIPHTPGKTK